MRLGVLWTTIEVGGGPEPSPNSYYRAIDPMKAMERRGHEVMWPRQAPTAADVRRFADADVVHVYRIATRDVRRALAELARRGTAITYDNDDDFTAVPKQSPYYRQSGGLKGQRIFAETAKLAQMATCCTTTNERLAEKYRRAGAERVEVVPNCLAPDLERPRNRHDGVVIGWVAAGEHQQDADRLKIGEVLRSLMERHPDVSVECIGINLGLPERYRHDLWLPFSELPRRIGRFDIGIAPLVEDPWNLTRSDIKLKEYAASGVPWLASPVGPYLGLGEAQGGRLVPDDGWLDALERLVTQRRERRRLARKAKAWGKRETIESVADRWEQFFSEACC